MATQTENYQLNKPEITDKVDITQLNANADIIDAEMHRLSTEKHYRHE